MKTGSSDKTGTKIGTKTETNTNAGTNTDTKTGIGYKTDIVTKTVGADLCVCPLAGPGKHTS